LNELGGRLISKYPAIASDVAAAGRIATAATDEVTSKLKMRLASLGAAPDYSSIVRDLQSKYELAKSKTQVANAFIASEGDTVLAESLSEYTAHVAECVAKVP
jgi:hypothetical protein